MSSCVSVIIPVYKVEKYLERCVNSVLEQTYKNLEVILVDDGSPDNCPFLCDKIAEVHENVSVVHKENGGLASARLAGFEAATGTYILFVDSDDYIANNMVEKLVTVVEQEDAEMSICGYNTVFGQKSTPNLLTYQNSSINGKDNVRNEYIIPLIGNSTRGINIPGFLCIRLFRRNLIQKSFFGSERIYYKEDHVFNLLYGDCINKIAVVNEPLYFYCFNESSLSNSYRKNKWEMYKNLYQFNKGYLEKRHISAEERLDNFLVSAVFASADNAVMAGSYSEYLKEINKICADPLAEQAIHSDLKQMSVSHRITMVLLRCRMYAFLYFIRKKRLGV